LSPTQIPAEQYSSAAHAVGSDAQAPSHTDPLGSQLIAPQSCSSKAGHTPEPSQVALTMATPESHEPGRHSPVVGYPQASRVVPSQRPPQMLPSEEQGMRPPRGGVSAGAAEHVPTLPETSQASHCPPQAASQHTPSVQNPLAQSDAVEQAIPSSSGGTQMPARHTSPELQSALIEHSGLAQSRPSQPSGQVTVWAPGHVPDPLQ
jgi:hypothetical protein